jgi:hypothetical protein
MSINGRRTESYIIFIISPKGIIHLFIFLKNRRDEEKKRLLSSLEVSMAENLAPLSVIFLHLHSPN